MSTLIEQAFALEDLEERPPNVSTDGIDTIHVLLSDLHTGSNHALFLDRHWEGGEQRHHYPNSEQMRMREHFDRWAESVRAMRQGKRVKLIVNGDAVDGRHHTATDIYTTNPREMAEIHIEIMEGFQKAIDWNRGDTIYYTRGTEVHTDEWEEFIGKHLNAVTDPRGYYVWDLLKMETNGVSAWAVHHGPGAGKGMNEGNSPRNWLRDIYADSLKDETRPPDIVYTGHVHNPTYSAYIYRRKMEFRAIHGVILPSWQSKTRFAWKVAPVSKNRIGGVTHEIKADGTICVPKFCVMETE